MDDPVTVATALTCDLRSQGAAQRRFTDRRRLPPPPRQGLRPTPAPDGRLEGTSARPGALISRTEVLRFEHQDPRRPRRLLTSCAGKSFDDRRDRALILLAADTGLRRGERSDRPRPWRDRGGRGAPRATLGDGGAPPQFVAHIPHALAALDGRHRRGYWPPPAGEGPVDTLSGKPPGPSSRSSPPWSSGGDVVVT